MSTAQLTEPTRGTLGCVLLSMGAVEEDVLADALEEQRRTRERLGVVLLRRGVDPEQIARALARQMRLPYVPPPLQPSAEALRLVDGALARRLGIMPLDVAERVLRIAIADPLNLHALDDVRFRSGRRIEVCVALQSAIAAAQSIAYNASEVSGILERYGNDNHQPAAAEAEEIGALRKASESPPIIELVELILKRAIEQRASDVHLEAGDGAMRVRARVDGVLREIMAVPQGARGAVVSRIKVMGGLDIATKRKAQDGRGVVKTGGQEVTLRVSTLPAQGGEKVVLRLLRSDQAGQSLSDLGLLPDEKRAFTSLLGRSHGLILVTGPTGSGKTTTLYAALSSMDRERRNILSLEDPVEYRLRGLTQVQVHRAAGLSFASALRATLRQDPDVIMVGELRDKSTVETALAAAMTGHLVLSTLHTNDAPSAVTRLIDMGAPPYVVSGALIGVIAQRLARRLCNRCAVDTTADAAELLSLGLPPRAAMLYIPRGCPRCGGQGYLGRTGIFEIMPVTAAMREQIVTRSSAEALRETARAEGMMSLGADAWRKVRAGVTSLEEVRPILRTLHADAPTCASCGHPRRSSFGACPGCGRRLRQRCACGAWLQSGWRFCSACGEAAK